MCPNFEREYQTDAELQWHELNRFSKQTYMFSRTVLVSWTPLGPSLQPRIHCTIAVTEAEYKSEFKRTKYALMHELWNAFCEDFRENWPHYNSTALYLLLCDIPDSKVHRANMGSIWGRQDPGGTHVGPMNFAIWDCYSALPICRFSK